MGMSKEEKLENTIFLKVGIIKDIENIIAHIRNSDTNKIKLKIQTKNWYGFTIPTLCKKNHKLEFEKETLINILESIIEKERDYINKCIDIEIELRKEK